MEAFFAVDSLCLEPCPAALALGNQARKEYNYGSNEKWCHTVISQLLRRPHSQGFTPFPPIPPHPRYVAFVYFHLACVTALLRLAAFRKVYAHGGEEPKNCLPRSFHEKSSAVESELQGKRQAHQGVKGLRLFRQGLCCLEALDGEHWVVVQVRYL